MLLNFLVRLYSQKSFFFKKALYIQAYTCKNFSDLCRYVCNAMLLCIQSGMNIYLSTQYLKNVVYYKGLEDIYL